VGGARLRAAVGRDGHLLRRLLPFLATHQHIGAVVEAIRRGLAEGGRGGSADGDDGGSFGGGKGGGCSFVGGFTYGEQGPIGENTHANLMYNVLLFGGPKPSAVVRQASRQLSALELAGGDVSPTGAAAATGGGSGGGGRRGQDAALETMIEQARRLGDARLVAKLTAAQQHAAAARAAAAAAAAAAARPREVLLDELREFLLEASGVYQSMLQLFAALDAAGESKVRLADFHSHLTSKLGFRLRDDEWATLADFLDSDSDGALSYGEIFAALAAPSPQRAPRAERRKWGRSTSRMSFGVAEDRNA